VFENILTQMGFQIVPIEAERSKAMPKHRVRSDNKEWDDLGPSCVNRGFSPENLSSKYPLEDFQTRPKLLYYAQKCQAFFNF